MWFLKYFKMWFPRGHWNCFIFVSIFKSTENFVVKSCLCGKNMHPLKDFQASKISNIRYLNFYWLSSVVTSLQILPINGVSMFESLGLKGKKPLAQIPPSPHAWCCPVLSLEPPSRRAHVHLQIRPTSWPLPHPPSCWLLQHLTPFTVLSLVFPTLIAQFSLWALLPCLSSVSASLCCSSSSNDVLCPFLIRCVLWETPFTLVVVTILLGTITFTAQVQPFVS